MAACAGSGLQSMWGKADGAEHRSGFIPLLGTVRSQQGEGVSKCLEAALTYCENPDYADRLTPGLHLY